MALTMARPWKHPKTGVYWLRRRVPDDLKPLVGKREEKRSLRTKDASEARRLHAIALAELEQRWANLRAPAKTISELDAFRMVQIFEQNVLHHHSQNPSSQTYWNPEIGKLAFRSPRPLGAGFPAADIWTLEDRPREVAAYEDDCRKMASEHLADIGLVVDDASREKLAVAIAHALQRSAIKLSQMANGDWQGFSLVENRPTSIAAEPVEKPANGPSLSELAEGWAKEKSPTKKTEYTWLRVVDQLTVFLGHSDAARISISDLLRWKSALMEQGLASKTIRDSKLAPVKAILQWGVDNGHLSENPCNRVTIAVKENAKEARRGFTDGEAKHILDAASSAKSDYIQWAPMLCAYSGARIAEVSQLRKQDVCEVDGIPCFFISADAGSLKNANSERVVPLHSAVLDAGFLDFVQSRADGPLFSELKPDRFGNRGGTGTKVLSRWVRELGIDDKRLAPNHSWRHRFKTLGRRHGLAGDLVNAITGHGRKTVADRYGEYPVSALSREIEKIPKVQQ
ncbi:site-specific integrase [Ensifer aridi]|uniref:site-specific integrase n=1 Tax=Ensifer aridi TaxID=1708715 RepID=UPI000402DC8F|nr:site-specific integrase [Ensifer aridi]